MLANFLEKSKPINFILYLGLFFCFYTRTIVSMLFEGEFAWHIVFKSILLFIIFLSIFFFFNFIVSRNRLTFGHSYAFYVFTLSLILFLKTLCNFETLNLLLIQLLFLRKVYSFQSSKKVIQKIFDSGFWLGILCLIEPFSILFFILIYASIFLQQKRTINNLITPIIGFISPLIIYFTYLFWNDAAIVFFEIFNIKIADTLFIFDKSDPSWIFWGILFLTLFSTVLKSPKVLSVNNSFKKSWILLIINAITSVVFAVTVSNKNGSKIVYFLIPASIIIANGFEVIQKKIVKNILIILLLGITVSTFFLL